MPDRVLAALLGLAMLGCASDENPVSDEGLIGNDYAQCVNHPAGTEGAAPEVIISIGRLVPSEAQVRCTDRKVFSLDDRQVSFVYIAYGDLRDCPSGCFSTHLCAVYDPDDALLYSAAWYSSDERPLSIPPDCPERADSPSGQTATDCSTPPQGFYHPVTQTPEFEDFRALQRQENGDLRFCFS